MSKEWESENVFDVLGCEVARHILALCSRKPLSAAELAEHCDVSEPTVYRRTDALQEYDMIDEETTVDDDGHHYKRFRTNLEEARIEVENGSFDVDIQLRKDYTDKFVELWRDMETGAEEFDGDERPSDHDRSSLDVNGL